MINSSAPLPRSEFDDLADLFLTGEGNAPAAETPVPSRPAEKSGEPPSRVAALLVVNLPVFSGPWVDQAAAHLASQRGPTALLRRREGEISVDLFATRDGQQAAARAAGGATADLASIVHGCRSSVSQWAVELRPEEGGPIPAPGACDELILVTGADEAAVVAAFQQIKRLDPSWRSRPIGLVVAGSEQGAARRAAERIMQTCRHSLDVSIELCGVVPRMQPIASRHLARIAVECDAVAALTHALSLTEAESPARPARPAMNPQPRADGSPAAPRVALRPKPPAASSPPAEPPAGLPRSPDREEPPPTKLPWIAAAEDQGASQPVAASARATAAPHETLANLVPGLQAMNLACPRAEDVEFAFDSAGRIHALIEEDSEGALQRLHVACDWAREHRHLLSRLNPFLAAAAGQSEPEIIAHLFTSRARERRHLADGSWRIHILIRDPVDASRIAAHVELN